MKVVNRSIDVMRIRKKLISCVKLDHMLHSINYGNTMSYMFQSSPHGCGFYALKDHIDQLGHNRQVPHHVLLATECCD